MLKKLIPLLNIFLILASITVTAFAHGGNTDGNGGHYNHSTGEYHYHHGYSAHQHPGGVCPYDYDDQTNHSSGSSSSSSEFENLRKLAEKHNQNSNVTSSNSIVSKSNTPSFEGFAPATANAKEPESTLFEKLLAAAFFVFGFGSLAPFVICICIVVPLRMIVDFIVKHQEKILNLLDPIFNHGFWPFYIIAAIIYFLKFW